ncbi:MAG: hypothetical protein CMG64_02690 [Candidatus Marinimicrobia bacterium]|nr:hypothetical protein [Candidatus Neomarinimicrobiota bacterium]|tara:strand:- start:5142 stop:5429 length:288 start_codon:yes stop_codon:yes gene_type:complete
MKLKIVYNLNIDRVNQVLDKFKTDFDCSFEKTEEPDVFKIFIDDRLAFNLEDNFDDMGLDYKYLCSKIDKFQKNKLLKSSNNQVGGLGDINFDEF